MEKTETSISFDDLNLNDFSPSIKKQVRMYALLLTVRKSENPKSINQFLVSDLSINEECAYPIAYFDKGFQFKEDIFVEPNQKFSVDVFDAKFKYLNLNLSKLDVTIAKPGFEFSKDLFNKKILVEITATLKRYKDQLDFSKAQMEPLTKTLLIKRAVTERDQPLINFLNRLKVRISSDWVQSLDHMYGFSDVMRRLNGTGYREDNDSDILQSQAITSNKRRRINPMADVSDPSRALIASILPNIKQEIMSEHSMLEEEENTELESKISVELPQRADAGPTIAYAQTSIGNSTATDHDSSESRIIEASSSHLIPCSTTSQITNSSTSQIIAHSTQQNDIPFYLVNVVGWYPRAELKIKNVYTGEIEFDSSFEIFVKYSPNEVANPENYRPIGTIKFMSCNDIDKLFKELASNGANDFNIKSIKIPKLEWETLFSKSSEKFSIYWDDQWDYEVS